MLTNRHETTIYVFEFQQKNSVDEKRFPVCSVHDPNVCKSLKNEFFCEFK